MHRLTRTIKVLGNYVRYYPSSAASLFTNHAGSAHNSRMANPHRVVVVGGGFGGLNVARKLRRAAVEVTLIDRRNFHLFQPLLYQVATGGLSPANIAAPLRAVLKRQANAEVLLGEVVQIDAAEKKVILRDGQ